jgi:hypothetical protein
MCFYGGVFKLHSIIILNVDDIILLSPKNIQEGMSDKLIENGD